MASWQHLCDTFLLSHCSLQNRFRQAKFLKVLTYLSDITTASERLTDTLERIWGECCKKFFIYGTPRNLNIYSISSLLIKMYYFVSTFIDSSGA